MWLSYYLFGFQLTECKDDPEYEKSCKDIALTTGLCEEQKEFTQEHCALSCEWCGEQKGPIYIKKYFKGF